MKFMSYKNYINEKFTDESDPIKDLGIGKKLLIEMWLKKMGIHYYEIDSNFEINVNRDVNLMYKNLNNLPDYIQFNVINGSFTISDNNLTSLRGCPRYVNSLFNCENNKLTTLEYAPVKIWITLFCNNNPIPKKEIYKYIFDTKFINNDIYINCDAIPEQINVAEFLLKNKHKRKRFINEK